VRSQGPDASIASIAIVLPKWMTRAHPTNVARCPPRWRWGRPRLADGHGENEAQQVIGVDAAPAFRERFPAEAKVAQATPNCSIPTRPGKRRSQARTPVLAWPAPAAATPLGSMHATPIQKRPPQPQPECDQAATTRPAVCAPRMKPQLPRPNVLFRYRGPKTWSSGRRGTFKKQKRRRPPRSTCG